MAPHFGHPSEKPATPAKSMKRSKPNSLRQAQVLPPHNVDLTLPPSMHEEMHVPAHVSGVDLSRRSPAGADQLKAGTVRPH